MSEFAPNLPQPRQSLEFTKAAQKIKLNELDDCRPRVTCLGPTTNVMVYSHNHSISNWKRGIIKRCAHVEKQIDPNVLKRFKEYVHNEIKKLPVAPPGLSFQELQEDWLLNSNYNGKRRQSLRLKAQEYFDHKISRYRLLKLESFIKSEFYNEIKECRIINSRSDWFKAVIGPYIHLCEQYVYDEHFIKHKTPMEVASIMKQIAIGFDNFYETDFKSFEGSFSPLIMKICELALFKHVLSNYPEAVSLIESSYSRNNLWFKGDKTHKIGCSFLGSRMSGEMWTSLANGFTNKMLIGFMLSENHTYGNFLVEGDDGYIASKRSLDFSCINKLGFSLTIKHEDVPDHVKFCSLSVCESTIVPDIRRVLSHYGKINDSTIAHAFQTKSKRSIKRINELMKAKAQSLLATSAGIPILQELALQQLRCYRDVHLNPKYYDWWEKSFYNLSRASPMEITPNMREYVEKAFSIGTEEQLQIETALRSITHSNFEILLTPARE